METPEQQNKADQGTVSVIGAGITITGNVEATVDLQVEGRINGDVRCATLLLVEGSVIAGTIQAERVRVSGTVEGSIETRDVAIESTGHIIGDIAYSRLKVASGAVVQGNLQHRSQTEGEGTKLKLVEQPDEAKKRQPLYFE